MIWSCSIHFISFVTRYSSSPCSKSFPQTIEVKKFAISLTQVQFILRFRFSNIFQHRFLIRTQTYNISKYKSYRKAPTAATDTVLKWPVSRYLLWRSFRQVPFEYRACQYHQSRCWFRENAWHFVNLEFSNTIERSSISYRLMVFGRFRSLTVLFAFDVSLASSFIIYEVLVFLRWKSYILVSLSLVYKCCVVPGGYLSIPAYL